MKTQFRIISYLLITMLFFTSCSTEELELNEEDITSSEIESRNKSVTTSGCVQHSFSPAITQEYNVSQFGFCTVSFDIGNLTVVTPGGTSNNIKYLIQVIEGPLDHPDGSAGQPIVHNFFFDSADSITNDTFDILYRFSDPTAPAPTLGFATDFYKRLKVSFGVVNQGVGQFCNPFKPENVFFTSTDDCPW